MNSLRISSSDLALDKSMSPLSKRDVYVGEHKKVYDELMKGKLSNQQKINCILYRTDKSGKSNSWDKCVKRPTENIKGQLW